MNVIDLYHMENYFNNLRYNFAAEKVTYTLNKVSKSEAEAHWFIKDKPFKCQLLCDDKVRYYYLVDDRNHALYGKSALYFNIQKNDKNEEQEPVPVFLGFDTDNDSNGLGLFLGGDYPAADMGENFDYGIFAQRFYGQINEARKEYKDYQKFARWVMKRLPKIIEESIGDQEIIYDKDHIVASDFTHIRGTDSLEFQAGLYKQVENGRKVIDTNIILELIGYRIYAAKEKKDKLYKFTFDQDFIVGAYEKALGYIQKGQFGSAIKGEVPKEGIDKNGDIIYNMDPNETVELGYSQALVKRIRLDGLDSSWTESFMR